MPNKGLLLTMTETPPDVEAEFNDWYDTEHLPERLAIPGFVSARRWVADAKPGQGKYLATYELESPAVLASPAYLARFRDAPTPWTRRMLGSCTVFKRWACEQLAPGNASPDPAAEALLLACGETPTERMPLPGGSMGVRHFLASSGEPRFIGLYEFDCQDIAMPRGGDWILQVYRSYVANG